MEEKNFVYEKDGNRDCPLYVIPAEIWARLARPPFRKRHPFIFWPCLLALLGLACVGIGSFFGDDESPTGDSIALARVRGVIIDVAPTLEWIRKIERNPSVRGVLVRVDSPGGGAAASQEIYAALARVAKKKPVVVSMGATAASGGLMVSMAAERIYANASTVTGSIGVRMDIPQLQGLMEKIGVGQETLTTAPFKNAASYTRPLTPEDRAYLLSVLDNMHEQFVAIVARGRKMPIEKARELANGKIYTGEEALKLGLIDELGGLDEAWAWLCEKTGVPADRKLYAPPENNVRMLGRFLGALGLAGALGERSGYDLDALRDALTKPIFLYQ